MDKVDVVIVSYSKDDYCKELTQNCIKSLFLSDENKELFRM